MSKFIIFWVTQHIFCSVLLSWSVARKFRLIPIDSYDHCERNGSINDHPLPRTIHEAPRKIWETDVQCFTWKNPNGIVCSHGAASLHEAWPGFSSKLSQILHCRLVLQTACQFEMWFNGRRHEKDSFMSLGCRWSLWMKMILAFCASDLGFVDRFSMVR